jgi:hypothetical protein
VAPLFAVSLLLMAFGVLALANVVPLSSAPSPSGQCIQSVVRLTSAGPPVCPVPTSNIQGLSLGGVWLSGSDTSYVGHTTIIAFAQGSMVISYQLGTGLTLTSMVLDYCTSLSSNTYGDYCSAFTGISVSTGALYGGLPTYTASSPTIALNGVDLFQVKLTDSSGASYFYSAEAAYQAASYTVNFNVVSTAGGGVPGATIHLTLNGVAYSTLTTGAAGTVSEKLPFGEFVATASAINFDTEASQSFYSQDSPTVTFTMTPETISSISVLVQAASETTIPATGATVNLFTAGGTQVGSSQTTGSDGKATFTGTFGGMDSYYITASWTLTNSTFGVAGTYTGQSLGFWPSSGATELVVLLITPPTGCVGSSCTPPPSLECLPALANAAILVTVVDSNSAPISGAVVSVPGIGGNVETTNAQGQACLNNVAVPTTIISGYKGSVTVSVSAKGYSSASQSVEIKEGLESSAVITLSSGMSFGSVGTIVGGISFIAGLCLMGYSFVAEKKVRR